MSNIDPTMSQITEINETLTRSEEEEVFQFVDDQLETIIVEENNMKKSYYNRLMPSFKEAANWVSDDTDISCFNALIAEFIGKMKAKHEPEKQLKENHVYISSNIPCETAHRHHGCNGFTKK